MRLYAKIIEKRKDEVVVIGIIDYGAGNLQSVVKALKFIGCDCIVTNKKEELMLCDGAVLPGVGSFADAVNCMDNSGMTEAVMEYINSERPFLGICLGLQLLFEESEESPGVKGLGVLKGKILKIPNLNGTLKIPHIGWNSLDVRKKDGIFKNVGENPYVYFVHSYYLKADDENIVSSRTHYGTDIDASVCFKNIYATQFHPEKSGKTGLKILNNFVEITGRNK